MLFTFLDRYDPNKASKHKYLILEAHKNIFRWPWVDLFGFVKSFFLGPQMQFLPQNGTHGTKIQKITSTVRFRLNHHFYASDDHPEHFDG